MMGNSGSGGPGDRLTELLARRGVVPLLGGLGVVVVVGILLVAVASGGGGGDGQPQARATANPGDSGGLAGGATVTPQATIDLTQPTVVSTRNPNAAVPGTGTADRLMIGKFNVDAPLSYKIVGVDGVMPNPNGPDDVAYYDFANWPGKGGVPGGPGNVVISGHVDSGRVACKNGTVPPPCQAVFWDISSLRIGDEVEMAVGGQNYKYRITSNQSVPAAGANWDLIVSATVEQTLTMITCGGDFNRATGEYTSRQVVKGVRI